MSFNYRSAINDTCEDIKALELMKLSPQEWNELDRIRTILRSFNKFTEYVSRSQPSIQMLARLYGEVGVLLKRIIRGDGEFALIDQGLISGVQKGKETFDKYYDLLSDTDLPYIASVLDPRIKTHWDQRALR